MGNHTENLTAIPRKATPADAARVAAVAIVLAVSLHILLGYAQLKGWIPADGRWLGASAARSRFRHEKAGAAIERYRSFASRWLREAEPNPMSEAEFDRQEAPAFSAVIESLHPEVRRRPDVAHKGFLDSYAIAPGLLEPVTRLYTAAVRFSRNVHRFYDSKSRRTLVDCQEAWADLDESLEHLRAELDRK